MSLHDQVINTNSSENRSKLLKLADGIKTKTRKKSSSLLHSGQKKKSANGLASKSNKYDPAHTNIEHLVYGTYKPRPSTPASLVSRSHDDEEAALVNGTNSNGEIGSPGSGEVPDDRQSPAIDGRGSPGEDPDSPSKCACSVHSPKSQSPQHHPHHNGKRNSSCNKNLQLEFSLVSNGSDHLRDGVVNEEDRTLLNEDMDIDWHTHPDGELRLSKSSSDSGSAHSTNVIVNRLSNSSSKIPQPVKSSLTNSKQSKTSNSQLGSEILSPKEGQSDAVEGRSRLLTRQSITTCFGNEQQQQKTNECKNINKNNETRSNEPELDQLKPQSVYPHIPQLNSSDNFSEVNYVDAGSTPLKPSTHRMQPRIRKQHSLASQQLHQSASFTNNSPHHHYQQPPDLMSHSQSSTLNSYPRPRLTRGFSVSSPFEPKFTRLRNTVHGHRRLPGIHPNNISRRHSFDHGIRFGSSPMVRRTSKGSINGNFRNEDRRFEYSNVSSAGRGLESGFNSFSREKFFNSSLPESSMNDQHPLMTSHSTSSFFSGLEKSHRINLTNSQRSQSGLQRNRPLIKGPPSSKLLRNRVLGDNRNFFDQSFNLMQQRIQDMYNEQSLASRLSAMHMGNFSNMFMMDEESVLATPKRIFKMPLKMKSFEESRRDFDKMRANFFNRTFGDFSRDMFEKSPFRMFDDTTNEDGPEQTSRDQQTPTQIYYDNQQPPIDSHFANLLSESQKEILNQVTRQRSSRGSLTKSSRPWSHVYNDSEARRVIPNSRSRDSFEFASSSSTSGSTPKPNSEPDVLEASDRFEDTSRHQQQHLDSFLLQNDLSNNESVLQRFKKTFSLRFARSGNNFRSDSPVQAKLRASLRSKSEDKKSNRSSWYDDESDINRENNTLRISKTSESLSPSKTYDCQRKLSDPQSPGRYSARQQQRPSGIERQMSTPHPIKSRDLSQPRPMRRHSTRNRLRRSLSQPQDIEKWNKTKSGSKEGDSRNNSESEAESDSQIRNPNSLSRKSSENQMYEDDDIIYVEALWDHVTLDQEELTFRAGEVIEVTDSTNKDWWWGTIEGAEPRSGWFPASFVRMRVNQDDTVEECLSKIADGTVSKTPKKRTSVSMLSNEQVRANVIHEIINTERDFVKHLSDVVEGYLKKCQARSDMFSEERIKTIFGNIQELYEFQRNFLSQLEGRINWDSMHLSCVGDCFLDNEAQFSVYCEFCNNHPLAVSELQDLYAEPKYCGFFEACRLMQSMIDISLDGFLLTPIQKICKYPLQLAELLKYTRNDHPDYEPVKNALEAMQRVAQLVNERKRRIESLEQIVSFQKSIENWNGPPLIDTCSMLIHSGDVIRHSHSSTWTREFTLFLFDHVMICCKKDLGILKKSSFIFKGSINMDFVSQVVDLEDGVRDAHFNVVAKNAFKLYSSLKDKWYMFQTKTSKEKTHWLQALADERRRVEDDTRSGFVVSANDKRCAQMAYVNHLKPRRPRAKLAKGQKPRRPDTAVVDVQLPPTLDGSELNNSKRQSQLDRNRAGSLPSYFNPALATSKSVRTPFKKKGSGWFNFRSGSRGKRRDVKRIK